MKKIRNESMLTSRNASSMKKCGVIPTSIRKSVHSLRNVDAKAAIYTKIPKWSHNLKKCKFSKERAPSNEWKKRCVPVVAKSVV